MKTQQGGCHCGKVRFEVTGDLSSGVSCNCSICQKRGYVLSFVTADQFKLLSGNDALTDYQFGPKTIHHTFCKNCGAACFGSGVNPKDNKLNYAVNLRCVDEVDLKTIKITEFDGKHLL